MKISSSLVLTLLLAISCTYTKNEQIFSIEKEDGAGVESFDANYIPELGYVDRAADAAKIAEVVATRFYGKSEIVKQRPYRVKKLGDNWIIRGTVPIDQKGGAFEVRINSKNGEIVRLIFEE